MGLGSVTEIPLADARARAAICRRLVRERVDPIERRRTVAAAAAPAKRTTFKDAAQRYYDSKKAGWRSDKHAIQFPNTMRDYVYPIVGELPVQDVDTDRVLKILEQELRDPEGKVIGAPLDHPARDRLAGPGPDRAGARLGGGAEDAPGRQPGALARPPERAATGTKEGPGGDAPRRPSVRRK